ncbi:tRNA glutamyl-Q(34) synthetase GluQRS [Nakamurella silvestris]|nr:tRNA glutamyl-Q(34) synthetase GluQRS [Nakamurella silvestris]
MNADPAPAAGRFAPSPSGDLHIGNLRTALLAWLFARSTGRRFLVRMEDLDRVAVGSADRQLADLTTLGLSWDGQVVRQSGRTLRYDRAIDKLVLAGLTYPCFCTRREIREAASAPHPDPAADLAYSGTCRTLAAEEVTARIAAGKPHALRLKAAVTRWSVTDVLAGEFTGTVDDFVLRRNDGVAAYNLAVVVDDAAQGVDQVVRGADLLTSAPRQAYLASLLGHVAPRYAHVPMALNERGERLAKRDGAVTLPEILAQGATPARVLGVMAASAGIAATPEPTTAARLLAGFDIASISPEPWTVRLPFG